MAEKQRTVCLKHSWLIHVFTDEHSGCFYLLAVANGGVMNVSGCVYMSEYLFSILWGIYPGVGLLGHTVIPYLMF